MASGRVRLDEQTPLGAQGSGAPTGRTTHGVSSKGVSAQRGSRYARARDARGGRPDGCAGDAGDGRRYRRVDDGDGRARATTAATGRAPRPDRRSPTPDGGVSALEVRGGATAQRRQPRTRRALVANGNAERYAQPLARVRPSRAAACGRSRAALVAAGSVGAGDEAQDRFAIVASPAVPSTSRARSTGSTTASAVPERDELRCCSSLPPLLLIAQSGTHTWERSAVHRSFGLSSVGRVGKAERGLSWSRAAGRTGPCRRHERDDRRADQALCPRQQ